MATCLNEAQSDLQRFAEGLEGAIRKALADYAVDYATLRYRHSPRTQASIIHDLMVEAMEGFASESDGEVVVHKKGNLRLVTIMSGKYKAKLKKLNDRLEASNIPTRSVLRFVWQQLSFVQVPAPTNLHIGYQIVDPAALASSKVWITCPEGTDVAWQWELSLAQAQSDAAKAASVSKIASPSASETPKKKRAALKKDAAARVDRKKRDGSANGGK